MHGPNEYCRASCKQRLPGRDRERPQIVTAVIALRLISCGPIEAVRHEQVIRIAKIIRAANSSSCPAWVFSLIALKDTPIFERSPNGASARARTSAGK